MIKAKVLGSVSDTTLFYGGQRFLPFIFMDDTGTLYMRKFKTGGLMRFSEKAILQTCSISKDELDVFKEARSARMVEEEVTGEVTGEVKNG